MQLKRAYFSHTHISNERTTRRLDVRPLYMRSAHYSTTVHIKFHPRVNSQRRHTAVSQSVAHHHCVSCTVLAGCLPHTDRQNSSQSECLCVYEFGYVAVSVAVRARSICNITNFKRAKGYSYI